ncbi:MAG: hypothetical protein IKK97_00390, partial [Phascolarctobacterium sp.]|nr:hypothetical protein [Phascolarctobacterium sp.]
MMFLLQDLIKNLNFPIAKGIFSFYNVFRYYELVLKAGETMNSTRKLIRHERLQHILHDNPFMTDEQ